MKMKFVKTLVALAIGIGSLSTNAQAACSLSQIVGKWGVSGQGTDLSAGNISYSFIGNFTFLANGTGTGSLSLSENGVVYPNIAHTINSTVIDPTSCKGTISLTNAFGQSETYTLLVLNGGLEISLMNNDGKHSGIATGKRTL